MRRSRTGSRGQGKKSALLGSEYDPWAFEGFSGYLAADEIYDGPFCVLFAVDSTHQKRLDYEVLDHDPDHQDIRRFLTRIQQKLERRGLKVKGITTDASPLYPGPLAAIFPEARHQVCEFHILKEITKDVLRCLSRLRKSLKAKLPRLPRGRPKTKTQKKKASVSKHLQAQITDLFDHRYLVVRHGLTEKETRIVRRFTRRHPEVGDLRKLMDQVYRLFDRRCRTETALEKLAKLRGKLNKFEHLGKVLSKLKSPNLEKALTFLDDKELAATSNAVERANRRHRKMQKTIYRVRTKKSLISRIACDLMRDKEGEPKEQTLTALHARRNKAIVTFTTSLSRF